MSTIEHQASPNAGGLAIVAYISAQGMLRHHLARREIPRDPRRQLVTLADAQAHIDALETRAELAEQAHVSAAEERDFLRHQVDQLRQQLQATTAPRG